MRDRRDRPLESDAVDRQSSRVMQLRPPRSIPRAPSAGRPHGSLATAARRVALACALSVACAAPGAGAAEYEACIDLTADVRALGSDDAFEWEPAANRLSALGPAAWPALVRALEREGPAVRVGIVGVLASGSEADDAVRQGLARVARKDPEVEARADAVAALRKLAGKQSRDVVVAALDDPSPEVRRKAIIACTELCTDDAALARLVALALGDEPVSNALQARRVLWSLTADGRNAEVVTKIRAATVAAAKPAAGASQDAAARRALLAALLLAELGDDAQLDALARAARPGVDDAIRIRALHAIGRLGGGDRVALVAELQQDPAVGVYANDALRRMSERGIAGAADAATRYTGPRPPELLPRP